MAQVWNPTQYEKFKAERSRPFKDLVKLVRGRSFDFAVDLGCGTGELTKQLAGELKIHHTLGIDSSEEMLAKSKEYAGERVKFLNQPIEKFVPEKPVDLLFSNAALQWVDDHENIIPKILSWVTSGGEVAIQMPCNFDHPSHACAAEAAHELFPQKFSKEGRKRSVLTIERYAEILNKQGFYEQNCLIKVYAHHLKSGRDVIEWTKGTLLNAYREKLDDTEFAAFLKRYSDLLIKQIGEGPYFYAFKRVLIWGVR